MDCSVSETRVPGVKLVQTTDFFYPLVDDPYMQGRIGCANVLSDLYSMGIDECDNMLMIMAASRDMTAKQRDVTSRLMMRGFNDLANEAGTSVTGGQTVLNPWPIIGGVASTVLRQEDIIMPCGAVAGDVLVLTKPLGTQVAVNMHQWLGTRPEKWAKVSDILSEDACRAAYQAAMTSMARLNRVGARLMRKHGAHAGTDVTGFGYLGHANNLALSQHAEVSLVLHTLPAIKGMLQADTVAGFRLREGYSAETSGGLLIAMPATAAKAFCDEILELDGHAAWIVGDVVPGDRTARFADSVTLIDV